MFDPAGKAKITMQGANGDTYEMDGYVGSVDMEVDHGMETSARVEFIASGPITLKGDFEPDPIPPAPVGEFVVLPKPGPLYRPWSWEACMIAMSAVTAVIELAVWGILKWVM